MEQRKSRGWTRCRACGCVNDPEAESCYLCGTPDPETGCSGCGTPHRNPLDTVCPRCNRPYGRAGNAPPGENRANPSAGGARTGILPGRGNDAARGGTRHR